ncbi:PaaI family thioesterase [Streptomyces sp. G45]|uniref:PaaI family thioesterase n=1 Tax=Streptomyces sp. G45 TaxID=3406627 RepID=UPI003C1A4ADE
MTDAAPAPGPLDLTLAQQTLAAQPFSLHLGAELTAFGDGGATLEIPLRKELLQQNGFVHGGVLAYAADNGITFAAGTALGAAVLTSGFTIQYVRPASGARLVARARVADATRRQAVVRCDLFAVDADGAEVLCAMAQGTVRTTGQGAGPASGRG